MPLHSQEPLSIEQKQGPQPDQHIIILSGPVVLSTLFPFQTAVRAHTSRVLVIDFTNVPYLDSAGVGALVGAYVSRNKDGRSLALVGVSQRVRDVLKVTHVETLFRFFPSVDEALQ